jgi:Tfp pilus assembly protein PilE
MKQSLKQQSGLTFIGLVFVLAIIAMVVLFVLRLFPLYNEKLQVEAAMQTVVNQPGAASRNINETRGAFMRALAVTNITRFTSNNVRDHVDIVKPARAGEPPLLHVKYQATNKLFADIQLLLDFDKQLPLSNTGGGN